MVCVQANILLLHSSCLKDENAELKRKVELQWKRWRSKSDLRILNHFDGYCEIYDRMRIIEPKAK